MNPVEFTHSQGDALRTVQEIFELAKDGDNQILIHVSDALNLAKCFIELENTIKQVREMVKAR